MFRNSNFVALFNAPYRLVYHVKVIYWCYASLS